MGPSGVLHIRASPLTVHSSVTVAVEHERLLPSTKTKSTLPAPVSETVLCCTSLSVSYVMMLSLQAVEKAPKNRKMKTIILYSRHREIYRKFFYDLTKVFISQRNKSVRCFTRMLANALCICGEATRILTRVACDVFSCEAHQSSPATWKVKVRVVLRTLRPLTILRPRADSMLPVRCCVSYIYIYSTLRGRIKGTASAAFVIQNRF